MGKNNSQLVNAMGIFGQALKLPGRNKKMFFFITISTIIPYSVLVLANAVSLVFLLKNLSKNAYPLLSMDPKSPGYLKQVFKIKDESMLLIFVEMFFLILMTMVSLLSMVATIYVSAMSYLGRNLNLKDLSRKVKKIWIRSLITGFYFSLLNAGYILFILALLVLVVISTRSIIVFAIGIVLLLLAVSIHVYLILVGVLSLVTSVLDDCYGLQALGKAEKLVNGRKVAGVVLTLLLMMLSGVIYTVSRLNKNLHAVGIRFLIMYGTLNLAIIVKILSMMVYTVFYCERKQSHGEQVEIEDNSEYAMVSKIPLVDSVDGDLP